MSDTTTLTRERRDLLETLAIHRGFLRHTVRDLTDDQAAMRPTASGLCLGGLIKHVAATEAQWAAFIERGAAAMMGEGDQAAWADGFVMAPAETLAGLLDAYQTVSDRTDGLVRTLEDLDAEHPLPEAPWFPPGAAWSARRVLLHVIAETAQHAGHADILRESIDGSKTMG
ncbi:MAG: DinB family protein [Acidimicrobiales bacterium]|nr:DinB family protein [Acidimicrobiales bacterium]